MGGIVSDNTDTFGRVTLRWSPTLPPEKRSEIVAKMQAIKPARRRAPVTSERARQLAQAHGAAVIARPDQDDAARVPWTVRVYYRSQGGEVLCFEAPGLTEPRAAALYSECDSDRSDAMGAQQWRQSGEAPAMWSGARLIVLPSQMGPGSKIGTSEELALAPVVETTPAPEPAPVVEPTPACLIPASEIARAFQAAESPIVGRHFQAAMARRTARQRSMRQ